MTKRTQRDAHGKDCTKCGIYKTWDGFYRHPSTSDGYQSWCKACSIAYNNARAAAKNVDGSRTRYGRAHDRVRRAKGPASTHVCSSCGGPAAEWAYDHQDEGQLPSCMGPYSNKVEHYQPMCISCHRRFDVGRVVVA